MTYEQKENVNYYNIIFNINQFLLLITSVKQGVFFQRY